ncbi:unnamed protein product [Prorocentrum cordatum]|uniref:Uncharacterized protein n=1 Tax=Prorocentrum cordatum TaxID=2364126 RepID=A0ABN9RTV3_9DINO|nr:unnamed protein product [Polarella glacialis]
MESEALGVPAESTLLYKVSGGLDIVIDELVLRIRNPGDTETRLRACLLGVRYCPAMPSGSPTHDLDMAIRPNLERCAVAYSYSFEVQSLELALVPVVGEPWAASGDAVVGLCGLRLSSHGSCPASRLHQAPFYMDGVLSVEIGEINATKGAVPVDGLSSLIEVMSRMVLSDNLRAIGSARVVITSPLLSGGTLIITPSRAPRSKPRYTTQWGRSFYAGSSLPPLVPPMFFS